MDNTEFDALLFFQKIAEKRNYTVNADKSRMEKMVRLITKNYITTGKPFCPCKMKNNPPIENIDPICPCDTLDKEIKENGFCRCKVFFK